MTAKIGNLGSYVFERGGRGNLRRIIMMLLTIGGLLLYVGGKVTIMRVGYQIEALQREKQEMERENSSLRIEASSLTSSARIEEIATKRLGMIRPTEDNVVIVKRKTAPRQ